MSAHPEGLGTRSGEIILRSDLVNVGFGGGLADPRVATTTLTSERILFRAPTLPAGYRWKAWTLGLLLAPGAAMSARVRLRPPLPGDRNVELSAIIRIWKWEPRLSDAPFIQLSRHSSFTTGIGFSFMLLEGQLPNQRLAGRATGQATWPPARPRGLVPGRARRTASSRLRGRHPCGLPRDGATWYRCARDTVTGFV